MNSGKMTIKALALGAILTVTLGASAGAHGHGGLHRGVAAAIPARAPLSAPAHGRNIRSGDHFGWHQGYPRS